VTPCNAHFRDLAERVKRGVLEAGGFPLEFPVMSLGEPVMRPTAMLFRNLASMAVEESIRANPFDGVVLLTGCDKTTSALVMVKTQNGGPHSGPLSFGCFRSEAPGEREPA
jgi:dihydroxy-acid dehydratase